MRGRTDCATLDAEINIRVYPGLGLRPAIPPTGFGRLYEEAKKEATKYVEEAATRAKNRGVDAKGEVLEKAPQPSKP